MKSSKYTGIVSQYYSFRESDMQGNRMRYIYLIEDVIVNRDDYYKHLNMQKQAGNVLAEAKMNTGVTLTF